MLFETSVKILFKYSSPDKSTKSFLKKTHFKRKRKHFFILGHAQEVKLKETVYVGKQCIR